MKITRITLREIHMPLVHFFETSFGRTTQRRIVLVEVEEAGGAAGWGEVTAGENPFYNEEWTESAWLILRDYAGPQVLGRNLRSACEVSALTARIRGHQMARGGLEAAVWDLEARLAGLPLWRHIGGVRSEIACGVSIGIQDSVEQLLQKIQCELEAGYQRIKIKIKPGWDVDVVRAVRGRFPDIQLMADANSAYRLDDAPHLAQLDAFGLIMLEQPLGRDDLVRHAELQRRLRTPLCLDESITDVDRAEDMIALGSGRIVNIKPGRVGGFAVARAIHDVCAANGIPVWCGGML